MNIRMYLHFNAELSSTGGKSGIHRIILNASKMGNE